MDNFSVKLREELSSSGIEHEDIDFGRKERITTWKTGIYDSVRVRYRQDLTCGRDFLDISCVTNDGMEIETEVSTTDWEVRISDSQVLDISDRISQMMSEMLTQQ